MAPAPVLVRNAALVVGWAFAIKVTAFDAMYGIGRSMEPTVPDGSVTLIDRLSPRWRRYQRGDVVLLRSPTRGDGSKVIKRILALVRIGRANASYIALSCLCLA
jgi:signal peptidase I